MQQLVVRLQKYIKSILLIMVLMISQPSFALPQEFIYLEDVDASIIQDVNYFSKDNFIGRPIKGYDAPKCILTNAAATALAKLQQELKSQSLGLKVFDCYRPQIAVDDFIAWSKDASDQKMKKEYYPKIDKADFFKLGYTASKSSHTRGSTVDLTLVSFTNPAKMPIELNMGTRFDFMDPASHPLTGIIHGEIYANRMLLRQLMQQAGFKPFEMEWWHFTLYPEPFPDTYFNFPAK